EEQKKEAEGAKSKEPTSKPETKKPKLPSKKKEDSFDIAAQQIAQIDSLLFGLDQALNSDLIDNIAKKPVDELATNLATIGQTSNLLGLGSALEGFADRLKGIKDERKKKQYGTLWQGINERQQNAKKKIAKLHDNLTKKMEQAERTIKRSPSEQAEEQAQSLDQLKGFLASLEKVGNSLLKIQDLLPESKEPKISPY
ncbi:MAG TPA: hypothetical protein VHA52_02855, partial [Candidatus Babeliaceae bacterium]|nr:hypothetical protein [Candidatus Babeliaceae bacterium]